MKLLFSIAVLALSACATTPTPPQSASTGANARPATLGTFMITGDELKQTGRPDISEALKASSPIFH
jgi:hypothetical protein